MPLEPAQRTGGPVNRWTVQGWTDGEFVDIRRIDDSSDAQSGGRTDDISVVLLTNVTNVVGYGSEGM